MIKPSVILILVAAVCFAAMSMWISHVERKLSSAQNEIVEYQKAVSQLEANVQTSQDNLNREIEAREVEREKWQQTLTTHSNYLKQLRRDAAKWNDVEKQLKDIEGRNETLSDYLLRAGHILWNDEPPSGPDTDSDADVSDSTETGNPD
jgi:septal ring factor EnvC (AmiA/AmiB activator)